ncbi:MAG: 4-hydroxythreonine-4-phosphate dehydrogenase PdxA [Crocinitomicaceae bacterium]
MTDKIEKIPVVGITIGEINGIGPEVIVKALRDNRVLSSFTPIIYGTNKAISYYKKSLNMHEFNFQSIKSANEVQQKKINLINVTSEEIEITPGTPTEHSAKISFQALESATQDLSEGKIDVLVTAPISKENIQKAGFNFPGHTEYLAEMSGVKEALMILTSGDLRVALVTTHIPVSEVSKHLSKDNLVAKIMSLEASLKKDFNIVKPKIAVFGLNPHAGENGKIGSEEQQVIIPAIQHLKNEGLLVYGPFAADGFFGSHARNQYDGVLAMYHDQGLAAFKALAFEDGVNYSAGLPIIRTSPDHGTAFDISGKGKASEQSMRSAIFQAIDIWKNRRFQKEINRNPLAIQTSENKKDEDL